MNDRFLSSRFFKPSGISKAGARTPPSPNDQQEVKQEYNRHEAESQDDDACIKPQCENLTPSICALKRTVLQIGDCSRRYERNNEDFDATLKRYESIVEQSRNFMDDVKRMELTTRVSQVSIDIMGKLLTNFCMNVQHEREELEQHQENAINNFVAQLKERQDVFLNKQDEQLAAYNRKLKRTLDSYGFWCSAKVFYWLLGIFLFLFLFMVLVIVLFWAGNLSFRTY